MFFGWFIYVPLSVGPFSVTPFGTSIIIVTNNHKECKVCSDRFRSAGVPNTVLTHTCFMGALLLCEPKKLLSKAIKHVCG